MNATQSLALGLSAVVLAATAVPAPDRRSHLIPATTTNQPNHHTKGH